MNIVKFDCISKSFHQKQILQEISFAVKDGEIFGLLGPSGAGKTTILNIMTGRMSADSGTAQLFGYNCDRLDASILKKIGTVLDRDGLYDRLSCYDNMLLYAQLYGIERNKIGAVLEKVHLQEASQKIVQKLSKGMRQRLVLARAILHNPKLLFLDEPTSGLDPVTMQEIHTLLRDLQRQGTTIILTTHNMQEATDMCDRLVLLNDGKIVASGTPQEICQNHVGHRWHQITLKNGEQIQFDVEQSYSPYDLHMLMKLFESGSIQSIHTHEPTLETVFIERTGRRLE